MRGGCRLKKRLGVKKGGGRGTEILWKIAEGRIRRGEVLTGNNQSFYHCQQGGETGFSSE